MWKATCNAATGKWYWWHVVTRETSWEQPAAVATSHVATALDRLKATVADLALFVKTGATSSPGAPFAPEPEPEPDEASGKVPTDCDGTWETVLDPATGGAGCSLRCGGGKTMEEFIITRKPLGGGKACPFKTARMTNRNCNIRLCDVGEPCKYQGWAVPTQCKDGQSCSKGDGQTCPPKSEQVKKAQEAKKHKTEVQIPAQCQAAGACKDAAPCFDKATCGWCGTSSKCAGA